MIGAKAFRKTQCAKIGGVVNAGRRKDAYPACVKFGPPRLRCGNAHALPCCYVCLGGLIPMTMASSEILELTDELLEKVRVVCVLLV